MSRATTAVFVLVLLSVTRSWTSPQSPFDRVIDDGSQGPTVVDRIDAHTVGRLAAAARTPMGFIGWDELSSKTFTLIPASGRRLRDVLDAMVRADSRYRVDDDNGVIVVSATDGLEAATQLLDRIAGPVRIENGTAAHAMDVISDLVDVRGHRSGPGDTNRFSVDLPATSTIRDVLNGVVRAHGRLTWSVTRANWPEFPVIVSLRAGSSGTGVGVPHRTVFGESTTRRGPLHAGTVESREPLLDRRITSERNLDFRVAPINASFVPALAAAARAPMGIEVAAVERARDTLPGTHLVGLGLREALWLISDGQSAYEWREVGGAIVFRGRDAWVDADDPLFRVVAGVELYEQPTVEVIDTVLARLGAPRASLFPDSRPITLVTARGTVLDLLNALVAAHGQLAWVWEEMTAEERAVTPGRYRLSLHLFDGGGAGYPVP